MKFLITIALIVAVYWIGKSMYGEVTKHEKDKEKQEAITKGNAGSDGLTGMSSGYEPSLQTAEKQGPAALKAWLTRYRSYINDPKLGDIQLDYAVMVARSGDLNEAKLYFNEVKRRTTADSPIYPRVKKLEATFGQ